MKINKPIHSGEIMKTKGIAFFCMLLLLFSCSKDREGTPDAGPGGMGNLSGQLFFKWTNGINKLDLKTGKKSQAVPEEAFFYSWDISLDGKRMLKGTKGPTYSNSEIFTLLDMESSEIIEQFDYYPENFWYTSMTGFLSPNEKMMAIKPGVGNEYVEIVDMKGDMVKFLRGVPGGSDFSHVDEVKWLPDNTILVTAGDKIYRSDASFSHFSLIKDMQGYEGWGGIEPNRAGTQIALFIGKHIYLMDLDGGDPVQVTTSGQKETGAKFSPDGKHLLLATDWRLSGPLPNQGFAYLAIIKADGKLYDLERYEQNKDVILIKNEDGHQQGVNGNYMWR